MPNLTHPPVQQLIQALPLTEHSVEVKAAPWREIFTGAGQLEVHDAIFYGRNQVRITRGWLRSDHVPNAVVRAAGIILWGYPQGARGGIHRHWIQNLPAIAAAAQEHACEWPQYYARLRGIGSLGISTISKLAYAFGHEFGGHGALILDQRILGVLAAGRWSELQELRALTYSNAHQHYQRYLETLGAAAAAGQFTSEQLEFFLFALGESF